MKIKEVHKIDEKHQYKIKISFPITPYMVLNKEINEFIQKTTNDFGQSLSDNTIQKDQYYTLYIQFEMYEYKHIISIVFTVETYTGGAHPNHSLLTFNYDTTQDKMITIDNLYEENKDILDLLSSLSRKTLLADPKFSQGNNIDMLKEGTAPRKDNFQNFVFTEQGLKIYFNYYQIAPYYLGTSEVTIPYQQLNLRI